MKYVLRILYIPCLTSVNYKKGSWYIFSVKKAKDFSFKTQETHRTRWYTDTPTDDNQEIPIDK